MKKCRITVKRISEYRDLMEMYEYPMENACDMHVGQTFIANGWKKPEGLCESASEMTDSDIRLFSESMGWHIRSGWHDMTEADWANYLDYMDQYL